MSVCAHRLHWLTRKWGDVLEKCIALATKIFKSNEECILRQFSSISCLIQEFYLRQLLSIGCQLLSISGNIVVVEICCSYLLCMVSWSMVSVNFPIAQSTIHYRSMLLLTTTILRCPSERSNELISLWSKCNALRTLLRFWLALLVALVQKSKQSKPII